MLALYSEYRGLVNVVLVFAFVCVFPLNVILTSRRQRARVSATGPAERSVPQHRVITALNEAGAIGIGIAWTTLLYRGPSLTQLWLGAPGISHWAWVSIYTTMWLSLSRKLVPENMAQITPTIIVRSVIFGFFFLLAIVNLNDL